MRSVTLTAHIPGQDAARVYARLSDLASYPDHSESVRSVTVTAVTGDVTLSRWEVAFRNGILRWSEQDTFDRAGLRIDFTQLDGDVEEFAGSWVCANADGGCRVTFDARIDLGVPTLADVLEPIATRALLDNTTSIVRGLFGSDVTFEADAAAAHAH
jgi:ribosome-associated toxin RatA of RatAB toxin-antitoxin module